VNQEKTMMSTTREEGFITAVNRTLAVLCGLLIVALPVCCPAYAEDQGGAEAVPPPMSDFDRARQLLEELDYGRQRIRAIEDSASVASGDEIDRLRIEAMDLVRGLTEHTVSLFEIISGLDRSLALTDSIRGAAEDHLEFHVGLTQGVIDRHELRLAEARLRRPDVPPDELGLFEARIGENERFLDNWLLRLLQYGQTLEEAGLEAPELWEWLDGLIVRRARELETRLKVSFMESKRAREQIESSNKLGITPDEGQMFRYHAAQIKADVVVSSLSAAADLLDARGLESAEYRILIIASTGQVTKHILSWDVLLGLARGALRSVLSWLRDRGPTVLVRIAIVLLFGLLFRLLGWLLWNLVRIVINLPKLLADLVGRLVRPTFTVIGFAVGLWFLGVDPTTLLAGLGVLSVIVGLALQDSLGNLAAGLFILAYKPYDVDEIVQAGGVLGRVKEMGLANTTIITFDNRRFFVPNRKIWGDLIENRSLEKVRRVQATVRVSYEDDIVEVLRHISEILKESDLILDSPAPAIFVSKLDDSWMSVSVWPWTRTENWWTLEMNLPLILRTGLAERGVTVPYPRRDIDVTSRAWPVADSADEVPPTS
jgi:small conductance mechanosensitive channel